MRISDWSSDVCSSDLIAQLHRLAERIGAGKTRAIGLAGFSEDDRLVLVDQIGIDGEGAERRLVAGIREEINAAYRLQIGRASCRERVCQYVSISVVAVSLKKK